MSEVSVGQIVSVGYFVEEKPTTGGTLTKYEPIDKADLEMFKPLVGTNYQMHFVKLEDGYGNILPISDTPYVEVRPDQGYKGAVGIVFTVQA